MPIKHDLQLCLHMYTNVAYYNDTLLYVDHEIQLATTKAYLLELERHVFHHGSLITPYLCQINAHLHNALLVCKAAQSDAESPSFTNKEHIPPRKNMEHQWRFTKTTKTPGRKRKGNCFR